jgi:hypothetical protein
MTTIESLAVWIALAFALWLAITLASYLLRLRGAGVVAAVLSWVIARAAMSVVPLLLQWLQTHLRI